MGSVQHTSKTNHLRHRILSVHDTYITIQCVLSAAKCAYGSYINLLNYAIDWRAYDSSMFVHIRPTRSLLSLINPTVVVETMPISICYVMCVRNLVRLKPTDRCTRSCRIVERVRSCNIVKCVWVYLKVRTGLLRILTHVRNRPM